ncbi:guanine nucleotide-binding protein subunit gamma 3-like isoform X1 [Olea europaea var. sylvestris]|uniref:guanine nucleotide-binding protein subunit gamma 3-like isoform X1 n=1 Tax=Olea europaea var. sylvestris TaxID=158386 RepID=UPI000C1D2C22|nr:guanine nucleotide-binding protein subunit gamma 3-like isoform X1 [Olea europaea var. sylvestris]
MGDSVGTVSVPPRPKSPPEYPDLYGKRRVLAKVQILEREISFLEEELKSVEGLQPASQSCKEIADFVTGNSDPLIPTRMKKVHKSRRFWKWLRGTSCFNIPWICYCPKCPRLHMPHCCDCNLCNLDPCICCSMPKCHCSSCFNTRCCNMCDGSCRLCHCIPKCPSCSIYFCFPRKCTCWYPKCPKVNICSPCDKSCCYCYPCYLCC